MKIENPYLRVLLIALIVPIVGYCMALAATGSPIAAVIPFFIIAFFVYKAVQWQRHKSKNKSD